MFSPKPGVKVRLNKERDNGEPTNAEPVILQLRKSSSLCFSSIAL